MNHSRSAFCFRVLVSIAAVFWLTGTGRAQQNPITYNLNYSANDLNMWGSGAQSNISWSRFAGPSWNLHNEQGDIEETWLGDFGATMTASTSGSIGLNLAFSSNGGGIDVQAPYRVTLTPSDDLDNAGNHTLNISSIVNLPAGQSVITTHFPSPQISLGGHVAASVHVGGEFAFFERVGGSATLFDFSTDFPIVSYNEGNNHQIRLFNALSRDASVGLTLPLRTGQDPYAIQVGTVSFTPPLLDASSGSSFSLTKTQEQVLNVSADILGAMVMAADFPINPMDVIVRVGPLDWEGRLFSARTGVSVGLQQQVTFTPELHMALRSSEALTYHLAGGDVVTNYLDLTNLNQQISFTKSSNTPIDFIPEFFVQPTLHNTLNIPISGSFDMEALRMTIGRFGIGLFDLGPLWSDHQNLGQFAEQTIFSQDLGIGNVHSFQMHTYGQGLTDKQPTIVNVSSWQVYQVAGTTGTFSTTTIEAGGSLQLFSNAVYLNNTPITIGGTLQVGTGTGLASAFQTPALSTSGTGKVSILGSTDTVTITSPNGWGDMTGNTLTRGTYEILGRFFYTGSDIVNNAANLTIGTTTDIKNGSHNALQSLASNSGSLTMNNVTLSVPNAFNNTGTLKLGDFSNFTTVGFSNSGTVEIGYLATVNTTGSNSFASIAANGTLGSGTYKILGELQYNGPDITTSNASITLSGDKSSSQHYFINSGHDGLQKLSTNNSLFRLTDGAEEIIDPDLGVNFLNNTGAVLQADNRGELTIISNVVNNGTVRVDGISSRITVAAEEGSSGSFMNNGTVELLNQGRLDVPFLGNLTNINTDNHTATLSGGTWLINNGTLFYGPEYIKRIASGTVVRIDGGSFTHITNGLSRLEINDGTLEHGGTLNTLFNTNTGALTITNGTFGTSPTINNSGTITIKPQAIFGNNVPGNPVQTTTNVDGSGTLSGLGNFDLAGEFRYRGPLISNLGSGINLTLRGAGHMMADVSGNNQNALSQLAEVRSGAQLHLADGALFSTNAAVPFTIKTGGTFSTDVSSLLHLNGGSTMTWENGATLDNQGGIFLNTMTSAPAGSVTTITLPSGSVTLSGGGVIGMGNSSGNQITGNGQLINQDNLIGGSGSITSRILNRGTIEAVGAVGLTIANGTMTNRGIIQSYGGIFYPDLAPNDPNLYVPDVAHPQVIYSSLNINNTVVSNFEGATPGLVEASAGLNLNNSQILGGSVRVNNGGNLSLTSSRITGALEIRSGGTMNIGAGTNTVESAIDIRTGGRIVIPNNAAVGFKTNLNNEGLIRIGSNSNIYLMAGQTGRIDNSGTIEMIGGEAIGYLSAPLRNLATGIVCVQDFSALHLQGGAFENAGIVALGNNGVSGNLVFDGNTNLTGGGTIQLGGIQQVSAGNYQWGGYESSITGSAAYTFTNVDNTIVGAGNIGGNQLRLINQGIYQAHGPGQLLINPGPGGFSNPGTIQVDSGAAARITGYFPSMTGSTLTEGTYLVDDGQLKMENGTFTSNAATIRLSGPNAILRGPGGVDMLSQYLDTNSGSLTFRAGKMQTIPRLLNNSGSITIGGTAANAGGRLTLDGLTGSGSVQLADATAQLYLGNNGTNASYAGTISGAGSLNKTGSNIQTLTGANTYSGGTTVSGGGLVGNTSSLPGNIINDASVTFNQASNGTYSGNISGSGGVTTTGSGILTFNGHNSYSGGTDISGPLVLGSSGDALPDTGTVSMHDHASITLAGNETIGSLASDSPYAFVTAAGHTLTINEQTSTTFIGALDGNLVKTGPGTLTLQGNGHSNGSITLLAGGLTGTTDTFHGPITNNGVLTFDQSSSGSSFFHAITGTGSVVKSGAGIAGLYSAGNNYTGGTVINGGMLSATPQSLRGNVLNNARLGLSLSSSGIFSGNISGPGRFDISGAHTLTFTGVNTNSGDVFVNQTSVVGTSGNISGIIHLNGGARVTFDQTTSGNFNGIIGGSGSLTKAGSGTVTLFGNNDYTGGTFVNAGTLELDGTNGTIIAQGTDITVGAGATLRLTNGNYNTIHSPLTILAGGTVDAVGGGLHNAHTLHSLNIQGGTLSGSDPDINYGNFVFNGTVSASGNLTSTINAAEVQLNGPITFNVADGNAAVDLSVSSQIRSVTGLPDSLVKTGAGTLQLSGVNTYSGGTTINAGTLQLGASGTVLTDSGSVTINGGTLALGANETIGVLTGSAGNINLGNHTLTINMAATFGGYSGAITGSGSVNKQGAYAFGLSGANTYSGGTLLSTGVLVADHDSALGTGPLRFLGGGTFSYTPRTLANAVSLEANAYIQPGSAPINFTGNWTLQGSRTLTIYDGTTTISGVIGDGGAGYTFTKAGDGALLLTGSNTSSGGTNITGGTLQLGNSPGSLSHLAPIGLNGGTLVLGNSDQSIGSLYGTSGSINLGNHNANIVQNLDRDYYGSFTGNGGSICKSGPSQLGLYGASFYTGDTVLIDGNLKVGNDAALGTGTIRFLGGSLSADGSRTLANAVSMETNASVQAGSAPINFTGNWTLQGSHALTVNDGTTTISGVIGESGAARSFTKAGAGTLLLTGSNTYTGGTTINAGTLQLGASGTVLPDNGAVAINGGTLALGANETIGVLIGSSGNINLGNHTLTINMAATFGAFGGTVTGSGSVNKQGGYAFSLYGANTYSGGTLLSNGVLVAEQDSSFGTGPLRFLGGGAFSYTPRTLANAVSLEANAYIQPGSAPINFTGDWTLKGSHAMTIYAGSATISGVIGENGGARSFTKAGDGALTLTNHNTYSGGTFVTGGTLTAGHDHAVGTGEVRVTGGTFYIANGVTLSNVIKLAGGSLTRDITGTLAGAVTATSDLAGGIDTTVSILAGNSSTALQLQTSFTRLSIASNDAMRLSDVFEISGTGTTPFVLQLSIDGSAAGAGLGWLNGSNMWVTAIAGNTGNNATGLQQGFAGSFSDFQTLYGTNLSSYLGAFGTDQATDSTWAVVNHNSDYAIVTGVPEPSCVLLLAFAGCAVLFQRNRRS